VGSGGFCLSPVIACGWCVAYVGDATVPTFLADSKSFASRMFYDVKPCILAEICGLLGGKCYLHVQAEELP
jgi:hypothetical protein